MYGRQADRSDCGVGRFYPDLLPGWAADNSWSILLNGRPLNGRDANSVQIAPATVGGGSCRAITETDEVACAVTSMAGQSIQPGDDVRITGVLGKDKHGDPGNLEIHPVYSIDVVRVTGRSDLTGVWGGPRDGATYYLRQEGSQQGAEVWWLGLSADRGRLFATAFHGARAAQNAVKGEWVGLPLGQREGSGSLMLTVSGSQSRILNFGSDLSSFAVADKLYDVG